MKKSLGTSSCKTSVLQEQPLKNACFAARRARNCKASAKLTRTEGSQFCKRLGILVMVLVLSSAVPAFSQEILATFVVGGNSLSALSGEEYFPQLELAALGINVLFIGKSGFTVSLGSDFSFNVDQEIAFASPAFGLGYVYKNGFYVGGILNFIPIQYETYNVFFFDGFIAPTFVYGWDFDGFTLGGQLAYMRGVYWGVNGFRYSINAGVILGGSR